MSNQLTEEEIEEAEISFRSIDLNGNGLLDAKELARFLSKKPQLRCFPRLIVALYGEDGEVSFEQYMKFYKALNADPDDDNFLGKAIFDYIDSDKSGYIDWDEIEPIVDLIDAPRGEMSKVLGSLEQADYEQFKHSFYKVLRMVWRSHGFQGQD